MQTMNPSRRKALATLGAIGLGPIAFAMKGPQKELLQRAIPSTGELLPAVGVGTWRTFDVGESEAERKPLKDVLQKMTEAGSKVIDSSPMYGRSQKVVGDLSTELALNNKLFIATKVWTSGEGAGVRQMNESFSLLKRQTIDLMQVHNLLDWQTHLKTLRQWKEEGKIRYIGITHYLDSVHDTLADAASPEKIARVAHELGCRSVAYTYNDPVSFMEYASDVAKACREDDIKSVAVTAG